MKLLMFIVGSVIFCLYILGYMMMINYANKSQRKEMLDGNLTSRQSKLKSEKIILEDLALEEY